MKIKRLVLSLVLFLNLAPAAWGATEAEDFLAPLLFPASADWLEVRKLPQVPEERLMELAPRLKEALRLLTAEDACDEDKSCCLAERLFEESSRYLFYSVDADGDGLDDILYSGYFPCGEAGLNIIWYGDGRGGYSLKGDKLDMAEILRLKPGADGPSKLRYEPGCCGNFINTYCQDIPEEPGRLCGKTFSLPLHDFDFKQAGLNEKIVFNEWVELRDTPEIKDEYDSGYSAGLGYVFVGNILTIVSSYVAPDDERRCRGTLVGYDQSGQWAMVVLEASCLDCQQFSVSKGDFIRVGWVKAEAFKQEQ